MMSTDRTPRESRPCMFRVHLSYDRKDTCVVSVVRHIEKYPKPDGIVFNRREVEIEPGNPIDTTLRCSLEQCDMYIVIFSKNYPTNNSCLLELATIVKTAKATVGKVVLPVFYGVLTDDVKLKTKKYNEQLLLHNTAESEATIQEWKDALLAATRINGFQRKTSDADLCREIVERVQDLMKQKDDSSLTATFRDCPNLQTLAGLRLGSTSRTSIVVDNCGISVLFDPSQRINLTEKMTIRKCDDLKKIPFEQLKELKEFYLECCSSIVSLSGVANAGKLQQFHVIECKNLREIEVQEGVRDFSIHDCGSLNSKIPRDKSSSGKAKVEMQQPRSSLEASSSSSLTMTTQQADAEKLTVEELSQFIERY